jgi:hypothetical protein
MLIILNLSAKLDTLTDLYNLKIEFTADLNNRQGIVIPVADSIKGTYTASLVS